MATTNLTLSDVINPASQSTWYSGLLTIAGYVGLPATSWQSGGIARTILAIQSWTNAGQDSIMSMAAQGGFLDFAATGTVQLTNPILGTVTTAPVTVDPSTLTGTALSSWQPGWLDILADGSYNCQRIQATAASGVLALTNSTGSSYGTYQPGTYHVANPSTGATYSNTAAFTFGAAQFVGGGIASASNTSPIVVTTTTAHGLSTGATVTVAGCGLSYANGTWTIVNTGTYSFSLTSSNGSSGTTAGGGTVNVCTTAPFAADLAGASGSSPAGTITTSVTALIGVTVSNTSAFTGSVYESNTALAGRCRLKLQSLSPNGTAGAYKYFAQSASQYLPSTASLSGGNNIRATVTNGAGLVTTTVANGTGAVLGVAAQSISGVTISSGTITIGVTTTTGISPGTTVLIQGTTGITGLNTYWTVTTASGSYVTISNSGLSAGSATGGTIEAGDLGLIDSVIQANAVPLGTTAITQSATAVNVTVAGSVYVPTAYATLFTGAVATALTNYFASLPIGGVTTDGTTNVVPIGVIEGIIYQVSQTSSGNYVTGITGLTLNGTAADVTLTATQVATLTNSLTVVGQ